MQYKLSSEFTGKRIKTCQEILEVLEQLDRQQKNHLITRDEYWIDWSNYLRGQWTADPAAASPRIRTRYRSKKRTISAYFTRQGFVSVEKLLQTEWFNSTFFAEIILPNIVQFVSVFRLTMHAQCHWIHLGNAKPYNSALSLQKTEKLEFTRLAQPSSSPDLTPATFRYSVTWTKNSMGRTSGPKTRWSLWWERFDQDRHSNALTSLRRMDREITRV
jgi:hypothetical protein